MSAAEQEASPLAGIETLAERYAAERSALHERVTELELELDRLKRAAMPAIRELVGKAIAVRDELKAAIEAAPECFVKPRTTVFHGIRVGFKAAGPKVHIDDEALVIERIRERLPKDQAELLIRKTEAVHKPAVYDLDDETLKRIGVRVTGGDGTEDVVIKPQDGAVAKVVDALLKGGDQLEDV